jgi:glycine/D-amino acid oxidase-like deaminating enzyme
MNAIRSNGGSAVAEQYDALIVGAGIVGAACAQALAEAGLSVGVIEAQTVGGGATAAGMGHIVVMDDSPAQLALTHYSQGLWDVLGAAAPEAIEYSRCGTLWVAADDEELEAARAKHAVYQATGIPGEVLDAAALYAWEPHLRPGLAGGLRVPGDSVIYPPRAAVWLLRQAAPGRVMLITGAVARLVPGGVQLADGTVIRSEVVVLANGAQVVNLAPNVPIRPKKGHLVITDRYPGFVRHQLVELGYVKSAHAAHGDSVAFNVQPRPTGQLLIGSSRQLDVDSRAVEYPILARMLARALAYMPDLARLSGTRVWTGVRAATPDGLPLIGPHPTRPGVWLATGHEGLGITTALGTAQLLTAQIIGQPPPLPVEPYLPARSFAEVAHA